MADENEQFAGNYLEIAESNVHDAFIRCFECVQLR